MQNTPTNLTPGAYLSDKALTDAAREAFGKSGKTQQQAAEQLESHRVSIANAIGNPDRPMTELRRKIIEAYGGVRVVGPLYRIEASTDETPPTTNGE